MAASPSEMIDVRLTVVDRESGDLSMVRAVMRRDLAAMFDQGFARWLTSPKQGRFLVMDWSCSDVAQGIVNCADEAAVIEQLVARYIARRAGRCRFELTTVVEPAFAAKLGRIGPEIEAIRAEARA